MCRDNSIKTLYDYGYNPIRLPSEIVKPFDILLRKSRKVAELVGPMKDIITNADEVEFPEVRKDIEATDFSGLHSDKFELNLGVKILDDILKALTGSSISLGVQYKNAHTIEFEYQNVKRDLIYKTSLAKFATQEAIPDINHPFVDYMDEEHEALIICEVLRSNSFGVETSDENGLDVNVDIAPIQNLLEGKAEVGFKNNNQNKIWYEGDKLISFAFKAIPIWIEISGGRAKFSLSPFSPPTVLRFTPFTHNLQNSSEPTEVLLAKENNDLIRIRKANLTVLQ